MAVQGQIWTDAVTLYCWLDAARCIVTERSLSARLDTTAERLGRRLEPALLKLASDVVFAHARLQRRSLEAESGGCAGRSSNQPFGFL
jgi:hypothetical protein